MNQKVGVLILGYNNLEYLKKCFNGILIQDYKNIFIYYDDNGSKDDSIAFVKNNYSNIKVRSFNNNYGYAKGNNVLLKIAFEDGMNLCFVLNPDTVLKKIPFQT